MKDNLLLVFSVLTGGVGQILFKLGMKQMGEQNFALSFGSIFTFLLKIIVTPALILGMLCYIGSSVIWMYVLSRVPLNRVYPFTALTFAVVFLASILIFHEQIPANRFIGVGIIVAGFLVTSIK